MTTEYTHMIVMACPENLLTAGNNLAVIIGEAEEDIDTFSILNYQDADLNKYSVVATVKKPETVNALNSRTLPPTPPHAPAGIDRTGANNALNAFNKNPNGIKYAADVDYRTQLEQWGLTRIEEEPV